MAAREPSGICCLSKGGFWGGWSRSAATLSFSRLPRDNSTDYIKRLIGLPGDKVQMRHGILYINDVPVQRDRLESPLPEPDGNSPRQRHRLSGASAARARPISSARWATRCRSTTPRIRRAAASLFLHGRQPRQFPGQPHDQCRLCARRKSGRQSRILFFSLDEEARFWQIWKWPVDGALASPVHEDQVIWHAVRKTPMPPDFGEQARAWFATPVCWKTR